MKLLLATVMILGGALLDAAESVRWRTDAIYYGPTTIRLPEEKGYDVASSAYAITVPWKEGSEHPAIRRIIVGPYIVQSAESDRRMKKILSLSKESRIWVSVEAAAEAFESAERSGQLFVESDKIEVLTPEEGLGYVESESRDAELTLELLASFGESTGQRKETFYFRRRRDELDGGRTTIRSSYGDGRSKSGKGVGDGFSAIAFPHAGDVELTLLVSWRSEKTEGKSDATIHVPYHEDLNGTANGISYSCHWTDQPNQSVQPTPGSVTPRAKESGSK